MNTATGEVPYDTKDVHSAKEVVNFFRFIDLHVAKGLEIHVVIDNLSAHKAALVQEWLSHRRASAGTCTSRRRARRAWTSSRAGSPSSRTDD